MGSTMSEKEKKEIESFSKKFIVSVLQKKGRDLKDFEIMSLFLSLFLLSFSFSFVLFTNSSILSFFGFGVSLVAFLIILQKRRFYKDLYEIEKEVVSFFRSNKDNQDLH